MKKLIILWFCFFGIYLLGEAQIMESVRVDLSAFKIQKGEEFDNIRLDNAELLEIPGQPNLPVYIESFIVPINAEVTGVKINKLTKQKLSGTYRIEPAQQPVPISLETKIEEHESAVFDIEIYTSTKPFPGKYAEIISDRIDYDYHIVTVRTFPVEYIPKTGEIYICDIE